MAHADSAWGSLTFRRSAVLPNCPFAPALFAVLVLILIAHLSPCAALAAQSPPAAKSQDDTALSNEPPADPIVGAGPTELVFVSQREFWLSIEVLAFGVIVVGLQFKLLLRNRVKAEEMLRVFGVTLILVGTLFAITAGFSAQDIGPALGLFGTVAGYLLGRRTAPQQKEAHDVEPIKE